IAIGLLGSTSEEFLFRLFGIPFLQKLTKSNVIAVVLPAFSWGFLYTAYTNDPSYSRGLEVGLIGVVAGVCMLRWRSLATLCWRPNFRWGTPRYQPQLRRRTMRGFRVE